MSTESVLVLKRKRRAFAKVEDDEGPISKATKTTARPPGAAINLYFVRLVSLIIEYDVPILFTGTARPRDTYAMLGAGGSFLVYREERTMNDLLLSPTYTKPADPNIVLKRTRIPDPSLVKSRGEQEDFRYKSILSELQILANPLAKDFESLINLRGLTWDYEMNPTDMSISVWPVLALQAAENTMVDLADDHDEPFHEKLLYCMDVAKALLFLHSQRVVHCDIKFENILICSSGTSRRIAKVSDFGSAILDVKPDTVLPNGIAGTVPWNAPESRNCLKGLSIFKTDVFSYGMLLWRYLCPDSLAGQLEQVSEEKRNAIVEAIEEAKGSNSISSIAGKNLESLNLSNDDVDNSQVIGELLQLCLALNPLDRCPMSQVEEMLKSSGCHKPQDSTTNSEQLSEVAIEENTPTAGEPTSPVEDIRDDGDDDSLVDEIRPAPKEPFYNDFETIYETFEHEEQLVKQQLIGSLKSWASQGKDPEAAAEAAYQLSICSVNGYGMPQSLLEGVKWMTEAAKLGNIKAKARAYRLAKLCEDIPEMVNLPLSLEKTGSWLSDATAQGSVQAAEDLEQLDVSRYESAIDSWRHRFALIEEENGQYLLKKGQLELLCKDLDKTALDTKIFNSRGYRLIHLASSLNAVDVLGQILEKGADIDSRSNMGETALLCAVRGGCEKAASYLLDNGASTVGAITGGTPLHWIIALPASYVITLAKQLVESGNDIECEYQQNEENGFHFDVHPCGTPLDWAVHERSLPAIRALIDLGADPFNQCSGCSALVRAVSAHDFEVLQVLSKSPLSTRRGMCQLDSYEQSLLFHALCCNRLFERLLNHGHGHMDAARQTISFLMEKGCDPSYVDTDGTTALHIAAGYCDESLLKLVLQDLGWKSMINDSSPGRFPISEAIGAKNIENVRLLLDEGAIQDFTVEGHTILHLLAAIEDENFACLVIKELDLPKRKDLDRTVQHKEANLTAFEIAVLQCNLRIADALLEAGAVPRSTSGKEPSLMYLIICTPSWDTANALRYCLSRCEPEFIVNKEKGIMALHAAASMMHHLAARATAELKIQTLLQTFKAVEQINAQTRACSDPEAPPAGQTPLHFAAKFGNDFATRCLLSSGADPSISDADGMTPLDLAQQQVKTFSVANEAILDSYQGFSDLQSTVELLRRSIGGKDLEFLPAIELRNPEEDARLKFSRLGFDTSQSLAQ